MGRIFYDYFALLCITYMLVFAAVIGLRYTQSDTPRADRIPGGVAGV